MNADDEHDALWDLLGKARQPAASPFFSRNVLREVRVLEEQKPGVLAWLQRRRVAVFATCGLVIAMGILVADVAAPETEEGQLIALAEQVSASPDYQVITHLDELLDSEESSVWLDASTTF